MAAKEPRQKPRAQQDIRFDSVQVGVVCVKDRWHGRERPDPQVNVTTLVL